MRRFYIIAPRIDGGAGPVEASEDDAKARHAAGDEVHFVDDDGPMVPVPRIDPAAAAPVEPEPPAEPVKKPKKG